MDKRKKVELAKSLPDDISSWCTGTVDKDRDVYDFITFWTGKSKIRIDYMFRRSKSLVYNEDIRDSVYHYQKDATYLNILSAFSYRFPSNRIPALFVE